MHICFATLDYPTGSSGGGVATVTRLLAQGMASRGHRVSVFQIGQKTDPYQDGEVTVYTFDQGPIHYYLSRLPIVGKHLGLPARELERSFHLSRALKELHDRHPIDIIEFSEEAGFFLAFSPLRKQCAYVARLHGTEYAWIPKVPGKKLSPALKIQRHLQRYFLRRCHHLVAVSQFYKDHLLHDLGVRTARRIEVLENPVQLESNQSGDQRKPATRPIFLFVGRIQDAKGIDVLLNCLAKLKAEGLHFRLEIAGGHHPSIGEEKFEQMLEFNGLQEEVVLLGYLNREQLKERMHCVHAVVVPSYFETFGMVGLEALTEGVPIIHSRVGIWAGLDEFPGLLLFKPGSDHELYDALSRSCKEDSPIPQIEAVATLKASFGLGRQMEYYEELLNPRLQS